MAIENLILFTEKTKEPESYDPANFRTGLTELTNALDSEAGAFSIKDILLRLKAALHQYPTIVHELLEEEIGLMTRGIKSISDVALIKNEAKSNKKKATGQISRSKLAELINKPPEDF